MRIFFLYTQSSAPDATSLGLETTNRYEKNEMLTIVLII